MTYPLKTSHQKNSWKINKANVKIIKGPDELKKLNPNNEKVE